MFRSTFEELDGVPGRKYRLFRDARALCVAELVEGWRHDASLRDAFIALLRDAPYAAFRWETPAVTQSTLRQACEFVLVDSPGLDRPADPSPFRAQFAAVPDAESIVTMENLRKDAMLIVPKPNDCPDRAYIHLAAFSREAPAIQNHTLWRAVATAMTARLNEHPIWLNTAGAGVAWLHIRLDSKPKYYRYEPYGAG